MVGLATPLSDAGEQLLLPLVPGRSCIRLCSVLNKTYSDLGGQSLSPVKPFVLAAILSAWKLVTFLAFQAHLPESMGIVSI